MINQVLAFWAPGVPELLLVLLFVSIFLPLIILPIIYIAFSIKARRRIFTELERLSQEVRSLRQKLEESPPSMG